MIATVVHDVVVNVALDADASVITFGLWRLWPTRWRGSRSEGPSLVQVKRRCCSNHRSRGFDHALSSLLLLELFLLRKIPVVIGVTGRWAAPRRVLCLMRGWWWTAPVVRWRRAAGIWIAVAIGCRVVTAAAASGIGLSATPRRRGLLVVCRRMWWWWSSALVLVAVMGWCREPVMATAVAAVAGGVVLSTVFPTVDGTTAS